MPPKTQPLDASELRMRAANKKHRDQLAGVESSFLGDNYADQPLWRRLNWLHVILLTVTPLLAVFGILTATWNTKTFVWAVVYYFATGLGITAGYHRLWAHRAYRAHPIVEWILMLCASGAVEGSIRWWCRDHRAHHRYVDTPRDPYAVTKGFWHAHVGWMLVKQDKHKIGKTDITDLDNSFMCMLQHRQYPWFALAMGFVLPTVVAGLGWGDWWGGYFIAGIARLVFVHHSTFCVNSLAHYWGDETYTDGHTAKNSVITALVTIGEGYHNFHHEFPSDYRNGVRFYQYDPTKWLIRALSVVGLTYDLKRFPRNEIHKGAVQMKQKRLNEEKEQLYWGPEVAGLPVWSWDQVKRLVKDEGRKLVVLDGCVLDLERFRPHHPGGSRIIDLYTGKDVSAMFRGEVYRHSNAAHNLQRTFRVATVKGYSRPVDSAEGHAAAARQ